MDLDVRVFGDVDGEGSPRYHADEAVSLLNTRARYRKNWTQSVSPRRTMKTKGQLEAEISEAIIKFEKEYMGRGPEETRTFIIDDMVLIRLRGVLTPAEKNLAKIDSSIHGRTLIKRVRIELLEKARTILEAIIQDITGQEVRSMHTDISTATGERVIIFTLNGCPQFEILTKDMS